VPEENTKERGTSSGSCRVDHFAPPVAALSPTTQKINVHLSFAEASRLVMAIKERLHNIHRLKRNSVKAKKAAVNLVVSLNVNNIAVMPGNLTESEN
jgi:hypothetical protein